jgi:uncharacterized protein (TIGR02300 family)
MSTITRGVKRRCASCDSAFYDLQRFPILCPKCGAVFDATAKSKLASVPRAPKTNATRTKFNAGPKAAPRKQPNEEAEESAVKPDDDTGTGLDEIDPVEDEDAEEPAADDDSVEEPESDDEIEPGSPPAIS